MKNKDTKKEILHLIKLLETGATSPHAKMTKSRWDTLRDKTVREIIKSVPRSN